MSFRTPIICWLALLLFSSTVTAAGKTGARLEKIGDVRHSELRVRPSLATADTCIVTPNDVIVWRIDGWVTGYELYKSLMDPSVSCSQPYPFTITEIDMPMAFDVATNLIVSVDVEAVDSTTIPGCPIPGVLLAISQEYEITVPSGGGVFSIWIPLDTPIVVNGPFFAGFYIGSLIDPDIGAAVLCDSFPVQCATFNIWDEQIGWIDLVNNSYYNFPGRLAMEVAGIPGGGNTEPTPLVTLLSPSNGDALYGNADLWCLDTSRSAIIDYVSFEYSNGGPFSEIGRDYDGSSPLRDGIATVESGTGYSLNWDVSGLPEGAFTIRATAYDTSGQSSSATVAVYVEPTPPLPNITSPDNGDDICPPLDIIMSCNDENISYIEIYRSNAQMEYSIGLTPLSQFAVGDADGDPMDGNLMSNGEFGNYYNGPVAAAVAVKLWSDRGLIDLITGGNTIEMVTEELAELLHTRANHGTYDEDLLCGLRAYDASHGDQLEFDFRRNPDYYTLRAWVEEEERVVIIGLSGGPATFLTVDGFKDWTPPDSSHIVSVANPLSGSIQHLPMRDNPSYSEIYLSDSWQRVDIMISLLSKSWGVTRRLQGADFSGADGWSFSWTPSDLIEDSLYFIRAAACDAMYYRGTSTVLVRNNCSQSYVVGDFNDDGLADIGDLFVLIDFIALGGDPPVGGIGRADVNCDNYVNVTDIVYYMNYLFAGVGAPCY